MTEPNHIFDKRTSINIGDVTVTEAVFCQTGDTSKDRRLYRLLSPGAERDLSVDTVTTEHYYIEDTDGKWFIFANVDCFAPPMAIVRARTFEEAYRSSWPSGKVGSRSRTSIQRAYPMDDRQYNENGTHIDAEGVQGFELTLLPSGRDSKPRLVV